MPDLSATIQEDHISKLPPNGDPAKANSYINQLVELISKDILTVNHTDLAKFDPGSLQDHYRLYLKDYEVEISHTKQPDSGKDCYVILFNNLKHINNGFREKIILAYMHLSEDQFKSFRSAWHKQKERRIKAEEEKRLQEAMIPIDQALEQLATTSQPL